MNFPPLLEAKKLEPGKARLLIGAYGFEDRSLGWALHQRSAGAIIDHAAMIRYRSPKGKNRIEELKRELSELGTSSPTDIPYDARSPRNFEDTLESEMVPLLAGKCEVIVDISAMTKLLILICLCKLAKFQGTVRVVYSEAMTYGPSEAEYEVAKDPMRLIAKFPSRGFESIVRAKCLSSVRMQGQPVTMIAFTSFNEQLVRHMLGTISPHRLLFINGRPPRAENAWRERATQRIHKKLIDEYPNDNPIDSSSGLLLRVSSTLDYVESFLQVEKIYKTFGNYERIICSATGSKMQTVGLFFSKIAHPDIHIEYPTPDSYYVKGMSREVSAVHEVVFPTFSEFINTLACRPHQS